MIIVILYQVKVVIIGKYMYQNIISIYLYRNNMKTYLLNQIN